MFSTNKIAVVEYCPVSSVRRRIIICPIYDVYNRYLTKKEEVVVVANSTLINCIYYYAVAATLL